ncbi:MAG: DUF1997 domain-containing protein [Leptolyngbyaceae cyanobacterium SM1_1_3]|nr:DUF1997 domain-containing protein [Leptolyngbyaceae cyanobacterium SM1_1_3]NJN02016.1 DUF1997 domain-containing protein [Leptolyngbyaceae cyanobacterium RM1_1_2]NJO08295.1 DUF1997 domain-containing protein [Leptolyngbyaceae cyanobacterium SL_1_1]
MLQFSASQSVKITVPQKPIALECYLQKPQRLVHALMRPEQVESLAFDQFRLNLQPLNFLVLKIQPMVDLEVHVSAAGKVRLRSIGCEIKGNQYISQRFGLNLEGWLEPHPANEKTILVGQAYLKIKVEPPPALRFTPKSLIESAGNRLLRSILATIKQRLMQQLLIDYERWVNSKLVAKTYSEAG